MPKKPKKQKQKPITTSMAKDKTVFSLQQTERWDEGYSGKGTSTV